MAEKSETLDSLQDGAENFTSRSRRDLRLDRERLNGSTSAGAEMVASLVEGQTKRLRAVCDGYRTFLDGVTAFLVLLAIVVAVTVVATSGFVAHSTTSSVPSYSPLMLKLIVSSVFSAVVTGLFIRYVTPHRRDIIGEIETASKLLTRLVRKLSQIEEHTAIDSYTAIEFDFLLSDAEAAISRANRFLSIPPETPAVNGK